MYIELFNTKHILVTLDTVNLKLGLELCPKLFRFTMNLVILSISIS
jgi:hypothetical protein